MKLGKVDLMSGLAKRDERALYMDYIEPPYYKCSTVFYVRKGNSSLIKSYDDLKKYLIGYVDNSAYFEPFDSDKNLIKRSVTTESQLIKMLSVGRVKIIIGTDCQVDYDIKKLGLQDKIEKAEYAPGNDVDLYLGISKKSSYSNNINKISQTLREIIEEGKIKEFAKKYYE
jgi:polar amino acid transport system substrate-binding protein